ncbi:hypothetical protein ASD53_18860 [Lysobacter sp. Root559]|nr:hypothetical protein ASD53_18860 [Lysobacter sp. Root559]
MEMVPLPSTPQTLPSELVPARYIGARRRGLVGHVDELVDLAGGAESEDGVGVGDRDIRQRLLSTQRHSAVLPHCTTRAAPVLKQRRVCCVAAIASADSAPCDLDL